MGVAEERGTGIICFYMFVFYRKHTPLQGGLCHARRHAYTQGFHPAELFEEPGQDPSPLKPAGQGAKYGDLYAYVI